MMSTSKRNEKARMVRLAMFMVILLLFQTVIPASLAGTAQATALNGTESIDSNDNLIANGGFETGLWSTRAGASLDTTVKHSGNQSASMTAAATTQYLGSALIPVESNSIYELSAWIKSSGISVSNAVSVNALMVDANMNTIGWYNTMKLIGTGGSQDWTEYKTELSQFAPGTSYIRIYVRLDGNVSGSVWFDDIGLKISDNMLVNGGFESGLWSPRVGGNLDTSVKRNGNQSVRMTAATTTQYWGSVLIPIQSNEVYTLSSWIKTSGISVSDAVSVNALVIDANMNSLGWHNTMKLIETGGSQDWTEYTTELSRFAVGAAYIRLYVRLDGNSGGDVWFDDIVFKPKDFVIGVNGPTGNIFSANEPTILSLMLKNATNRNKQVQVDYGVKDSENNLILTGSFDTDVDMRGVAVQELDFSAIDRYGVYTLEITVTGDNGNMNEQASFPFSRAPVPGESTPDSIFGTAIHLLNKTDANYVDTYLTQIAQTGIQWIRDDARWIVAETVKGQISIPPAWDMFVDTALSKGISPLFIVDYGNPFYDDGKAPHTDEGIAAYARYAGELAEHFLGRVDHFEIWNEWNIGGGNPDRLSPEAYAKVLKAAYAAIKAVNPDAVVIGGVTSGADAGWISRVLAAGGYDDMDAVSVHPYTYPINPDDGGFVASLQSIKNLFQTYGPAKPIWVTEIGWPTSESLTRGVNELTSGANVVKTYTLALGSGLADKVFWYDFKNDPKPPTSLEGHFGLVRGEHEGTTWSAKENYVAYRALTNMLAGAEFVQAYAAGDQVQAYRFYRNSDQKDVLVLWSKGDAKNLSLTLGTPAAVSYDLFGNGSDITADSNGSIILPISEVPTYVEGNFAHHIEVKDPYHVRVNPQLQETLEGKQWHVSISIDNNMNTGISGEIQLSGSSPWDQASEKKMFTAAANQTATITYAFPGEPEPKLYNLQIQTTLDGGVSAVVERKISFLAAQQTADAPVIDGVLSQGEWSDAMPILIDQTSQVQMTDWGGVNDLSGSGYIQWDNDYFYYAVAIKDDVHVQAGTNGDIWRGDSIQFTVDPGRKSGAADLGYNEIGIALNSNTSNVVVWRWTAASGVSSLSNVQASVIRDDNSNTTTYEMAIPWDALLPVGVTAVSGTDLGFAMLINDNDGSGRRGWMEYMGGIGLSKDRSAFGDLLLVPLDVEMTSETAPQKPIISDNNGHDTGLLDGNYEITMHMWWGNNGSLYQLYENDVLIDSQLLSENSPHAQTAVTSLTGRSNGIYRYVAKLTNESGTTGSDEWVVQVNDASPGKPMLSDNNWDGDGNFNLSMNMWWGTNGTTYQLYENGVLIDTQSLSEQTPQAQFAVTAIRDRLAGTYEYRCELSNSAGTTSSETTTVTVLH
ncbi:Glycosyl hydrolase catalytic core [Paenibacillus sp. UNCCL117]|uniref:carbohydrate binding domain-containing protein n=2 Tax=unclassified Paenibacillus TaxID=185978 RepID=UPI000889424A|nr:carbohydrate binding domain-containing protein [Paenibacillus sp. UNCCL117]SDE70024.1 Glycosyl hydrolase catalytic core [Paenibacillus sp. cl123]SFW71186.1 Glycosyl hydrolase catalytic core [Paenibacillus sp. UNCCL117]